MAYKILDERDIDLSYTPESENAQSGVAVAQVVEPLMTKVSQLESTLEYILQLIQSGGLNTQTIAEIEQLIVSYLENKTIEEVEA